MKKNKDFDFSIRVAKAIAGEFGSSCEVVVHDLRSEDHEHSIIAIENGHITGRSVGDGPSRIVLESLKEDPRRLNDRISYLTRTADGKILKSTTIYIRDAQDRVIGLLGINYDVSMLLALDEQIRSFTSQESAPAESAPISRNVSDLLEELMEQSVKVVGKPVAIMTKEDKIRAVRFLNDSGAFLITKSGPKVCKFLGISIYTLYSYLDEIKSESAGAEN
ncbi:MAG: transcriptional regulator [Lachnospiraceae bacterium]|nr:transcriptional regulator [Lachnospiraceae bacterium]